MPGVRPQVLTRFRSTGSRRVADGFLKRQLGRFRVRAGDAFAQVLRVALDQLMFVFAAASSQVTVRPLQVASRCSDVHRRHGAILLETHRLRGPCEAEQRDGLLEAGHTAHLDLVLADLVDLPFRYEKQVCIGLD